MNTFSTKILAYLSIVMLIAVFSCARSTEIVSDSNTFEHLFNENKIAISHDGKINILSKQSELLDALKSRKLKFNRFLEERIDNSYPNAPMLFIRAIADDNSKQVVGINLRKQGDVYVMSGETNSCKSKGNCCGCGFVRDSSGGILGCSCSLLCDRDDPGVANCEHTREETLD